MCDRCGRVAANKARNGVDREKNDVSNRQPNLHDPQ